MPSLCQPAFLFYAQPTSRLAPGQPRGVTFRAMILMGSGSQDQGVAWGEHRGRADHRPGQQVEALRAEVKLDRAVGMADQEQVVATARGFHATGKVTTMRNPIEQTALEALQILDDQIAGRLRQPVHVLLSSELVERGSA